MVVIRFCTSLFKSEGSVTILMMTSQKNEKNSAVPFPCYTINYKTRRPSVSSVAYVLGPVKVLQERHVAYSLS